MKFCSILILVLALLTSCKKTKKDIKGNWKLTDHYIEVYTDGILDSTYSNLIYLEPISRTYKKKTGYSENSETGAVYEFDWDYEDGILYMTNLEPFGLSHEPVTIVGSVDDKMEWEFTQEYQSSSADHHYLWERQ